MQTYPENVQPDSRATLATLIYGNRFHADQTLTEYLIEFLLIFCAEKEQNNGGRLRFHNPDNKDVLYYTVEPRMGLKRFIFFDKSKKNDGNNFLKEFEQYKYTISFKKRMKLIIFVFM